MMKKPMIKGLFFAVFSSALACAVPLTGADDKKGGAPAMPVPVVETGKVSELAETATKKYVGRLAAYLEVQTVARISGIFQNSFFKEGDFVQKGQKLIQLEDTTYVAAVKTAEAKMKTAEAQIETAKAQLMTAAATLAYAQINYDRQMKLESVSAQKERDEATRDLNLAKAAKASAQAALSSAEAAKASADAALLDARNNLSYTTIYAEAPGITGKTSASPGNLITPSSSPLVRIECIDPIRVKFAISEPDYLTMFGCRENMKKDAVVRIRLSDRSYYPLAAKVFLVDNKVDAATGTLMVWAQVANKDYKLTPGGLVDVLVSKSILKKYPAVKISAVQTDKDGNFVWLLVQPGNIATKQRVKVGDVVGDMQLITEGLAIDQTVITDGAHKIMRPGSPVKPIPGKQSTMPTAGR